MMKIFSNWQTLWQKKKTEQSASLETNTESCVSQPEQIQHTPLLLRSCKDVKLSDFIDCYCHEIYSGLGAGTPQEVAEAWSEIVSEWSDLMKNENGEYLLDIASRILNLKAHITYVEFSTFYLQRKFDQEILDKLIGLGYPGKYPEDDREQFLKALSMVISLSKAKVYQLWELNDEYSRLEKNNSGTKATEDDFEKNILRLSKYQGYRINKYKTTVFEYAHIHNNFIEDIKNNNNKGPDT